MFGVGIFLGIYLGLQDSLSSDLLLIMALVLSFFGANVLYVVSSESFCNFCATSFDFGNQNAFAGTNRGRVHAV